MNIIEELVAGRATFDWAPVTSRHEDLELTLFVLRDAMKFDGIRRSATVKTLQTVADLIGAMLLTPKVVDLIWEQATTRIDSVVNIAGHIVADLTDELVSKTIDKELADVGGDRGGIIDSVGKYWVLVNKLLRYFGPGGEIKDPKLAVELPYGIHNCCNYGWPSSSATRISEVTPRVNGKPHKVWQNLGFKHNDEHLDPSQTIRLMFQQAVLKKAGKTEVVHLHKVARDPALAPLISHEGVLRYLRVPAIAPPRATMVNDVPTMPFIFDKYPPPPPFRSAV